MKMKAKIGLHVLFTLHFTILLSIPSFSQDLIYTISGEISGDKVALDSILFENISNGTRVLFDNLPDRPDYVIDLTTQEFQGTTDIDDFHLSNSFKLTKNTPGLINITCTKTPAGKVNLSVYNIQGQKIYSASPLILYSGNSINVELANADVYIVKLETSQQVITFKAVGSPLYSNIKAYVYNNTPVKKNLKSQMALTGSDFNFKEGDSLRVSVYKDGYYTRPKSFKIERSASIHFVFEQSSVNTYGTSDAFIDPKEYINDSMNYDTTTGVVRVILSNDTSVFHKGDIITIDADTTGFLRKVTAVSKSDSITILKTEPAYLNDIFVDTDLKLNTAFIEPKGKLTKSSTSSQIISMLTDKEGYIHPVKVIYYDKKGNIIEKSIFEHNKRPIEDTIKLIDFNRDLSDLNIYGKTGDNVHFYIDNGNISFAANAIFELIFDYNGELTEDTKVKRGDLQSFKFYLEGNAGFMSRFALDMNKSSEKEATKKLIDLEKVTAKFIVPPSIPVWITFDVDIYGHYHLHSDASLHADWGFESNHTLQVGGLYEKETKTFTPINKYKPENIIYPLNITGEVNVTARFELYPRAEIKFYDFFGPYAEIVPFIEGNYNAAMQSQTTNSVTEDFLAWNSDVDLGLDLRVGTVLSFIGLKKEFGPKIINCFNKTLWRSPANISLLTTLPDKIKSDSSISLTFEVTDLLDNPAPLCPVYLNGDGTFGKTLLITNSEGQVTTTWTNSGGNKCNFTAVVFSANKDTICSISKNVNILPSNSLEKGLVAYYPFNGNANDESGNGNNGSVYNATLTMDRFGNVNSAYYFNGQDSYIKVEDNGFSKGQSFTVSLWIYINGINPSENYNNIIINKEYNSNQPEFRLNLGSNQTEPYNMDFEGNHSKGIPGDISFKGILKGKWYHFTLTYDSSGLMIGYLNGTPMNSVKNNGPILDGDQPIYIGSGTYFNHMYDYYFWGKIDDIRIYNRALSSADVNTLYHEGGWENINENLIAYYPFNGNANDESGNGHNGTINGAVLTTDRFGNQNSAYYFDGQGNYIDIGPSKNLNIEHQITVSSWVLFESGGDGIILSNYNGWEFEQGDLRSIWTNWTDNLIRIQFGQGDNQGVAYLSKNSYSLNDGKFHHIVYSFDETRKDSFKVEVWLDGDKIEMIPEAGSHGDGNGNGGILLNNNVHLRIGANYWPNYLKGKIDDIMIYKRVLTPTEIQILYHENGWPGK